MAGNLGNQIFFVGGGGRGGNNFKNIKLFFEGCWKLYAVHLTPCLQTVREGCV